MNPNDTRHAWTIREVITGAVCLGLLAAVALLYYLSLFTDGQK